MQKVTPGPAYPLHGVAQTRRLEALASAALPAHALMQRAGLAVARLALAVAPHARHIWVACGPGNNGGDGIEAAIHLKNWGKQPMLTWLGKANTAPSDTAAARQRALDAGVPFLPEPDAGFELVIDALLGIGSDLREPQNRMAAWISQINASAVPVLSVDVPSGLQADTGHTSTLHVRAQHTLSLLSLKPGLFTARGRDAAGTVWLDALGVDVQSLATADPQASPAAFLAAQPSVKVRLHASHKGSYGDVAIIGGATGMTGAALLAATAALHAGAGRVFVTLLDSSALAVNVQWPELMFRPLNALDFSHLTLVCGCGGGTAVRAVLPAVLAAPAPVVLDADALNALASESVLQAALKARAARQLATVITPHPLEAARLLDITAEQVQLDRLAAAQALAQRFACVVVLKGSGSVIAGPEQLPVINPTGNARLATAGTGDVLAGMVGAALAAGERAFDAACHAVYRHGALADAWPAHLPLTAGALAQGRVER